MNYLIASDEICLYWEKPEFEEGQKVIYHILVNGKEIGRTEKTHYTLMNLEPETVYEIEVIMCSNENDKTSESFWRESLQTQKQKKIIDVTQAPYCAVGDGKTMNTQALQKAFDDCKVDEMVYLPEGIYMTGTLRMHSNMELYLAENAVLQGTDVVEDYLPRIKSRFEGLEMECYSSLLNLGELDHTSGYNCENVVIRGKGTIASGGRTLAERVIKSERERLKDYLTSLGDKLGEYEKPETIPGRVRPRLINMSNARNIRLSDVTLKHGASWNVHMIYSDSIVTNNCTFHSVGVWNGDGWDPDSSTNCTIFNCTFYTHDDSIAIKSGKNPEGNVINRPTEHIRIFDCRSMRGLGIAMGSEMSGGIRDVEIWDCDLSGTIYGVEIKGTKKRGGFVRDVHVRDCIMPRIMFHSVGYNDDGIGALVPPVFEQCSFRNIYLSGKYQDHDSNWHTCDAIELRGFNVQGHYLTDILFENIQIESDEDGSYHISMKYCNKISLKNISCV